MDDKNTWSYANPAAHLDAYLDTKITVKIDGPPAGGVWLNCYAGGEEAILWVPAADALHLANMLLAGLSAA